MWNLNELFLPFLFSLSHFSSRAQSLTRLGWRQLDLQPLVGCEHLIHMIKEGNYHP